LHGHELATWIKCSASALLVPCSTSDRAFRKPNILQYCITVSLLHALTQSNTSLMSVHNIYFVRHFIVKAPCLWTYQTIDIRPIRHATVSICIVMVPSEQGFRSTSTKRWSRLGSLGLEDEEALSAPLTGDMRLSRSR
jgi:hypothetical protein